MMQVLKGNLIDFALAGRFDVIIHGCNCFCTMGAGIAKRIRDHFPQAFQADLKTPKGDPTKLGTYSAAQVQHNGRVLTIVNGYTQYHFAGNGTLVDYGALKTLFARIKTDFSNNRIGYPKIGAGLAKGDWKIIADIIDTQLKGEDHTVVEYVTIDL